MSKRKVDALVCDLCDEQQIDYDIETLGIKIDAMMYHGPGGGGGIKNVFVCEDCLQHKPISDLTSLVFRE